MKIFVFIVLGTTIKLATIAPEGSYWYKIAMEIKETLQTQGVKLVIYAGASMGDEPDIVKKLRMRQLNGAAMTSHGLELIAPETRAYELPLVFESYEEFYEVRDRLMPEHQKIYEEKGYRLLTYFSVGFEYIFSTKDNPWGGKLWLWFGDIFSGYRAKELSKMFRLVPLQISDVLQALSTGLLDSFHCPHYACQALQWLNYARSYIPQPTLMVTGGVIIRKDDWDKIDRNIREKAEKEIYRKLIELEKKVVASNEEIKAKMDRKLKKAEDHEKLKEFKEALIRTREKILAEHPEIRKHYELIQKTLEEIRKRRK